jgi:hypothetical protein
MTDTLLLQSMQLTFVLQQCDIYYKQCMHMLDVFIALASPEVQAKARVVADAKRATLPKFLFKEFKEQGRPPTP